MTEAEFAGMADGVLACVRHDPDVETKGAEAVAREHILNGLRHAHAAGLVDAAAWCEAESANEQGSARDAFEYAAERIRASASTAESKE